MKIRIDRKRTALIIVVSILLFIFVCVLVYFSIQKQQLNSSSNKNGSNQQKISGNAKKSQTAIIHMAAMGDMLAHDTIIANATTENGYNFSHYFQNIRTSYKNANVVFCNQEGLSSGPEYGISGYPSFNAPTQFSADLQSGAGCNLINLANNHMGDKGVAATNATIDVWSKLKPLAFSGANEDAADQQKTTTFEINGIKVGFVSFADFNNNTATPAYSVNIYHDEALVRKLVGQLRANSDVVIVSMHWGIEDSNAINADQQNQVNLLSSLGVDVIIGTGPHVLQKVQIVNRTDGGKTVVWYSLGNMLSSQLKLDELIGGIAKFDIQKSSDNKISISNLTFVPTYMHYDWTAAQSANNDLLARKNAMIYLLDDAAGPLSTSLFNTTVATERQYVIDTLGPDVSVK
jgi:poly-gamma-glutamate synthesis protein (capsule biosynthesis protein)